MFANEHYADRLVERMGWALVDAEHQEEEQAIRAGPTGVPGRATPQGSTRLPQSGRASAPVAHCNACSSTRRMTRSLV
jgi:hypothetical protein